MVTTGQEWDARVFEGPVRETLAVVGAYLAAVLEQAPGTYAVTVGGPDKAGNVMVSVDMGEWPEGAEFGEAVLAVLSGPEVTMID